MNELETSPSPIQRFYADSIILITGATGFMGKCLLEKLLRSCPQLEKIYVLIREKKGKTADKRLDELFEDILFSKLKSASDKYRDKVAAIAGDVSLPDLGLTIHDRNFLERNVNIVFHVAATVKFDEKIKLAMAINVQGTKEVLELCKTMDKLKSVVHVSTVYSNCHLRQINEQYYKCPLSYDEVTSMLDKLDDATAEELTPRILGEWPNTYTFTKALAESLIREQAGKLPLVVFRPAIVVSTWREPLQGWIDNIYGPTGVCAGALMGILSTICCKATNRANIVPVDMTVNALLACAWHIHDSFTRQSNMLDAVTYDSFTGQTCVDPTLAYAQPPNVPTAPPIYNYVSTVEKPITWGEFCGINSMYGSKFPSNRSLWIINFNLTESELLHTIYMIFLHFMPAVFIDAILLVLGKQPRFTKIYKQTDKFTKILAYFCKHDWQFTNDNVQVLWQKLDARDKKLFYFSITEIDWLQFFQHYMLGMRMYLCKDDESTLPTARRKQNRFYWMSVCLKMVFYYVSMYTILCTMHRIFKLFLYPIHF